MEAVLNLPDGLASRAATMGDVEAVTELIAACELAADGVVDIAAEDLRGEWSRPSFDLTTDIVLVFDSDRLVAYAEVFGGRDSWVDVHPEVRGGGLGIQLLRWTEARAREQGGTKLGQTVSDNERDAASLLVGNGYTVRWYSWMLEIALDEEPATPRLPAGVSLRTLDRGRDDRAVYELIDTAFSEWPDRDPSTGFEDWAAASLYRDDADPTLTLLLEDGDALVGASFNLVYGDEGWIQQLAVKRSHRGRGLGRAMLQASFGEFFRRGLKVAGLSTESRTGALGLYEHVGMRVVRSYTKYAKHL